MNMRRIVWLLLLVQALLFVTWGFGGASRDSKATGMGVRRFAVRCPTREATNILHTQPLEPPAFSRISSVLRFQIRQYSTSIGSSMRKEQSSTTSSSTSYDNVPLAGVRGSSSSPDFSVGIDLGTTNSLVAYYDPSVKCPRILPGLPGDDYSGEGGTEGPRAPATSPNEDPIIPSMVAYLPGGKNIVVGRSAERTAAAGAGGKFSRAGGAVFGSVKRVIGRDVKDARASASVESLRSQLHGGENDPVRLKCPAAVNGTVNPEEVSAQIVKALSKRAEMRLGGRATKAVITVPAWFNERQRQATLSAGQLGGFEKVQLLREPEAAALAYGVDKSEDQLILVFDLGGGTFDCSVLEVGGGAIEVIATGGNDRLGGDDFDSYLVSWACQVFKSKGGRDDIEKIGVSMARLKLAMRAARERLSDKKSVTIKLEKLDGLTNFEEKLTREKFEEVIAPLLERLMKPLRQVALTAGVALPGDEGASEMLFQDDEIQGVLDDKQRLEIKRSKRKKERTLREMNLLRKRLDESAGQGQKKKKKGDRGSGGGGGGNTVKLSKIPQGQPLDQVVLVGGATRTPSIIRMLTRVTGIAPSRTVDPDYAVALGASIQAAKLDGTLEDLEVFSPWKAALMRALIYDKHQKTLKATGEGIIPEYIPVDGDFEDGIDDFSSDEIDEGDEEGDNPSPSMQQHQILAKTNNMATIGVADAFNSEVTEEEWSDWSDFSSEEEFGDKIGEEEESNVQNNFRDSDESTTER